MRCPFADWDPISGPAGRYTSGPFKIVSHKTQGSTYAGARAAYAKNRSDPHFTVDRYRVRQHIDTALAARALRNADGGVQTGRDSAIQIEVVGYSGTSMHADVCDNLIRLYKWLQAEHHVPWVWPMGRPPVSAQTGYGLRNGVRDSRIWDTTSGHFAHSQVPENTHWDPAWTDLEWWVLNEKMGAVSAPVEANGGVVFSPPLDLEPIVAQLKAPNGGVWLLATSGAIYAFEAPFYGTPFGKDYWSNTPDGRPRTAARLEAYGHGYTVVATDGCRYDYA